MNCFQVFMIFGLWHQYSLLNSETICCELLSSFYDLWSLTSSDSFEKSCFSLWIAFKFLWSLVFDICFPEDKHGGIVVNCFQVFMIFGLWHPMCWTLRNKCCCELLSSFYDLWSLTSYKTFAQWPDCCELLSSFYDLWSLTSQFDQSHNSKGLQDVISIKKRAE